MKQELVDRLKQTIIDLVVEDAATIEDLRAIVTDALMEAAIRVEEKKFLRQNRN